MNKAINIFSNPCSRMACQPTPITTAPINPPTSACEELLGKPRYQVNKFQKIALANAASNTCVLIVSAATISCPIVSATATPKINGPKKLARAVIPKATRGESALDEIIVATTLLESWMPFKKSNRRASTITAMMIGVIYAASLLCNLDDDIGDDIGRLVAPVGGVAQVAVDLA